MSSDNPSSASPQPQLSPIDIQKSNAEESLDAFDSLDDLEKNFQNIISQLVTDKSLDSFRVEYEKIHAAFLKSHSNNAELVKRCRALNTEILANSTKVNSILQLSQDDQRTIAGLRFEFEKAWKMVELSQEKENKSREVIDQMKLEISNLSKLVETGGVIALTQETSLQSIQDEVNSLQKEITLQNAQIQGLQNDYDSSVSKHKDVLVQISSLKEEYEGLEKELEEHHENQKALGNDAQAKSKEMNQLKQDCKKHQEESENNIKRNLQAKQINETLNQQLIEEKKSIRDITETRKDQVSRLALVQKVLEDKKKLGQHLIDLQESVKNKMNSKDSKKTIHLKKLTKLNKEKDDLTEDFNKAKVAKEEVKAAMNDMHNTVNGLRNEIYNLTHEAIRKESMIAGTNRSISLLQRQNTIAKNEVYDEKKKAQSIEGQRDGIENELLGVKAQAHKNRMALENVKTEIEHYSRMCSDNKSNLLVVESDIKIREEEIKTLDVSLQDYRNQINKQNNLSENVLQQRDFLRQQVEIIQKECQKIDDDNRLLYNDIHAMKETIRQKDTECVAAHLRKNKIENNLIELTNENIKLENGLKEAVQNQCTLENKLMRARYLRDIALADLASLKRANEKIESDYRLLELSIHNKSDESSKLHEKCRILSSTITATAQTYSNLVKKVDDLKNDLSVEMKKIENLRNKSQHSKMLKLESIRLEKAKLLTQGKVRALEDELETPMMIHRWRFLEGTNPEAANLIKMSHILRSKMMLKMATLNRYRESAKEWEERLKIQQSHIRQTTINEHKETVNFFESILRQKTQQLEMLTSQISGQQENVEDSKSNVEVIRQQLRDTKTEFYNEKKITEKLRASSQISRKNANMLPQPQFNNSQSQNRYIGGGFAVSLSGTQKSLHFSQIPKPFVNMGNAIITPVVKTNSKQVKSMTMAAPGWNPIRKPLQPLLPTVSEINS